MQWNLSSGTVIRNRKSISSRPMDPNYYMWLFTGSTQQPPVLVEYLVLETTLPIVNGGLYREALTTFFSLKSNAEKFEEVSQTANLSVVCHRAMNQSEGGGGWVWVGVENM